MIRTLLGATLALTLGATRAQSQELYFEYQVDQPVRRLASSPKPTFPPKLLAAKIEGTVLAQYVVDTLGIVDTSPIKILKSPNDQFSAAVTGVLPRMRFVPAVRENRKVRQVVQEPFVFSLSREARGSPRPE